MYAHHSSFGTGHSSLIIHHSIIAPAIIQHSTFNTPPLWKFVPHFFTFVGAAPPCPPAQTKGISNPLPHPSGEGDNVFHPFSQGLWNHFSWSNRTNCLFLQRKTTTSPSAVASPSQLVHPIRVYRAIFLDNYLRKQIFSLNLQRDRGERSLFRASQPNHTLRIGVYQTFCTLTGRNFANSQNQVSEQSNGRCPLWIIISTLCLAFRGFPSIKADVSKCSAWGVLRCSFRLDGQCEGLGSWNERQR